jgi:DNA-binding transcriptional ArsR family regulator
MSMQMPPEPARAFAALGDPVRLGLLETLSDGRPRSIAELAAGRPMTRQGIAKHLRVLEGAQIVLVDRVGREARFRTDAETIAGIRDYLVQVARGWESALLRLKDHVENS